MSIRVKQVIDMLETFCPPHLAEPDDPIGLQIGDPDQEVSRVSVALEVTREVVDEAIRRGAQLIFAHHPIIYRPLKTIRTDRAEGKLIETLIMNRIAVYVAHTNLDSAEGGINDMMARALQLPHTVPLNSSHTERFYMVELQGKSFGLGRVGELKDPVTLRSFAESVKQAFGVPALRVAGDLNRKVKKVAVLGGAGRSFVNKAIFSGADVFVTGDIDHHTAHDALAAGLAIVDPGHHAEQIMKKHMADWLNARFQEQGIAAESFASEIDTEPFLFR